MRHLQFERLAQLIAISAIRKDTRAISELCIKEQSLHILFSDYVKSQVHLNIVEDLYGRSISDYAKALYYLQGRVMYRDSALLVLSYFYSDMSKFLINNSYNIKLKLDIDFELEEEIVDFETVKKEYLHVVKSLHEDGDSHSMLSFPFSFILDFVDNYEDAIVKADSYTLAAILQKFSTDTNIKKVVLRGGYET